ncbi:hypothetical protein [Bradyrhizobium sp. 153]|uniref:hypothetical protein n=1 Tax=Bradyrhizobium sp. 153 TaxID=2782627 RepID=UPI001FF735C6|nr:hypothetical protein [Bradyrhizobium sp. 153]MCK1668626.1 hypothetical protein [Bradyrhizobium sp. 153]
MSQFYTVRPEWLGATAYIIAGGPSVRRQNLNMLKGRHVIVVNSSYEAFPDADFCFFADSRWWEDHKTRAGMRSFKGRVVAASQSVAGEGLLRVKRIYPPPGLADAPDTVATQRTSLQGAMNLAVHLGVARIVLLGADMGRAPDGSSHHHSPHKWPNKPGNQTWDVQMAQFRTIVEPLKARNVDVVNTSPDSRLPWWPKRLLSEVV